MMNVTGPWSLDRVHAHLDATTTDVAIRIEPLSLASSDLRARMAAG